MQLVACLLTLGCVVIRECMTTPIHSFIVNSNHVSQNMTPTSCDTREWTQIEGAAVMVEVGTDGKVFVVNRGGMLWER